jgi:hypothetical protein
LQLLDKEEVAVEMENWTAPAVEMNLRDGAWSSIPSVPEWPTGVVRIALDVAKEAFGALSTLSRFVLRAQIGKGRYLAGQPLNYHSGGTSFPMSARGKHLNSMREMIFPLDRLPCLFDVLGLAPAELDAQNATNLVDQRYQDNMSLLDSVRLECIARVLYTWI